MKKITLLILIAITLVGCRQKVNALTLEEAQKIALNEVEGKVLKAREDKDDGVNYYEFIIIAYDEKYEVEIAADSGKVIKTEKDDDYIPAANDSNNASVDNIQTMITIEEAQRIALDRVGGGYLTKTELDVDDGIKKYEIEIKNGNKEYDIEVNGDTGEIIKYDEDVD